MRSEFFHWCWMCFLGWCWWFWLIFQDRRSAAVVFGSFLPLPLSSCLPSFLGGRPGSLFSSSCFSCLQDRAGSRQVRSCVALASLSFFRPFLPGSAALPPIPPSSFFILSPFSFFFFFLSLSLYISLFLACIRNTEKRGENWLKYCNLNHPLACSRLSACAQPPSSNLPVSKRGPCVGDVCMHDPVLGSKVA